MQLKNCVETAEEGFLRVLQTECSCREYSTIVDFNIKSPTGCGGFGTGGPITLLHENPCVTVSSLSVFQCVTVVNKLIFPVYCFSVPECSKHTIHIKRRITLFGWSNCSLFFVSWSTKWFQSLSFNKSFGQRCFFFSLFSFHCLHRPVKGFERAFEPFLLLLTYFVLSYLLFCCVSVTSLIFSSSFWFLFFSFVVWQLCTRSVISVLADKYKKTEQ